MEKENLDQSNNKNVSLSLIAEYGGTDSESDDTETHENNTNDDSDATELSEMVLKNNIINACAHGPLSRPREEDSSRHMIIDSAESGVVEYEVTEYRDMDSDSDSSSSSDSSDSDVDSVKDIEEVSSGDEFEGSRTAKPEPPKVNGELSLDELPPIEDLAISLPAQETTKIGTIASIVDRLVIVRALPETPAVDLDSVLFLDNGAKALGRVFDVFGPVTEPHYCVRFNSLEHVRARGAAAGADVYIAPASAHTNYVFLSELMKIKGSDASWLHDVEPPSHQVEYSDDEEERRANRARKEQRQQNKQEDCEDGETRKVPDRRNQRPSESSSRFGSGPSRGRNPFAAGSRRNNPNAFPRAPRPWSNNMGLRTAPPHPNDPGGPYTAPPNFNGPPMFPPPFNPNTPPPFMGNMYQFGNNTRMPTGPMPPMGAPPPFRHNVPIFGSNYCSMPGPHPQWVNNGPPPPPGT